MKEMRDLSEGGEWVEIGVREVTGADGVGPFEPKGGLGLLLLGR